MCVCELILDVDSKKQNQNQKQTTDLAFLS